jgi:hypothetical protein
MELNGIVFIGILSEGTPEGRQFSASIRTSFKSFRCKTGRQHDKYPIYAMNEMMNMM